MTHPAGVHPGRTALTHVPGCSPSIEISPLHLVRHRLALRLAVLDPRGHAILKALFGPQQDDHGSIRHTLGLE
ncbi:MAG: hypothetical protein K8R59_06025 [Thermoanaerobaculales bacterium]|nr:hypothetical protein [Thermoanaerobaculales bacterium]